MSKLTIRRRNKEPRVVTTLRLVHMDTPRGEFLRFMYVQQTEDGSTFSMEPPECVFDSYQEASEFAYSQSVAAQLPVLHVQRLGNKPN